MNILNMIEEQLSPQLVGQIGKSVGETPEATKFALENSLPALLGSAAAEASSPKGASDLLDTLKQKMPQGGWPDSVSSLASGVGSGASFVSSLLGSKMNMIRDFIASRSGIKTESAASLLGIGGKLVMAALGKQVSAQGLGASGFGQLLRSQVPHLQGLVSPDLANMLGIGNILTPSAAAASAGSMGSQAINAAHAGYDRAQHAVASTVSPGAKALGWILIPLAILVGLMFLFRHNSKTEVGNTLDQALVAPSAAVANFADQFKTAISSADATPADLQWVNFDSTGSLTADAKAKLATLGNLINAAPGVKATITTYGATTDDAANKASAIKSALVDAGVSTDRITTQTEVGQGWPKVSFTK